MSFYSVIKPVIFALFVLGLLLGQAAPAQDKEEKKKASEDLTEVRFNLAAINGEGKPADELRLMGGWRREALGDAMIELWATRKPVTFALPADA